MQIHVFNSSGLCIKTFKKTNWFYPHLPKDTLNVEQKTKANTPQCNELLFIVALNKNNGLPKTTEQRVMLGFRTNRCGGWQPNEQRRQPGR